MVAIREDFSVNCFEGFEGFVVRKGREGNLEEGVSKVVLDISCRRGWDWGCCKSQFGFGGFGLGIGVGMGVWTVEGEDIRTWPFDRSILEIDLIDRSFT